VANKAEKYLIIGGDGKLGSFLGSLLKEMGLPTRATTRRQLPVPQPEEIFLDLGDRTGWSNLPLAGTAFICAGITSVEQCEADPEGTRLVNVKQTADLASFLSDRGCHPVLVSTNRVYDGHFAAVTSATKTCPTTEYGRQKADVENRILALPGGAVLRVSKIMFPGDNMVFGWMDALAAGRKIEAVGDMYQSPVTADLVAETLLAMADDGKGGLFQLSATTDWSYLEIARHLARTAGQAQTNIREIPRTELSALKNAKLAPDQLSPRHTTLDSSDLLSRFGIAAPTVEETLRAVMERG
jgi:dTDP-4-dehydrorhamnose reductase